MDDEQGMGDVGRGTAIKVHDSSKALTLHLEAPSGCTIAKLKQEISEKHPDNPAVAAQRVCVGHLHLADVSIHCEISALVVQPESISDTILRIVEAV
jgi:hypothetical protein